MYACKVTRKAINSPCSLIHDILFYAAIYIIHAWYQLAQHGMLHIYIALVHY